MRQPKVLNVAIVGGGPGCKAIMDMIFAERLSQLRMKLIGVADTNPNAVGYCYGREKGIFTTEDYRDLYKLERLNLIIELTGRDAVANEIFRTKPDHVRLMDHVAARLFWDIFHLEEQRIAERKRAEGVVREKERFLKTVFDAIQDGIAVLDCDLNIILVNPWMEKMFAAKMPLVGKKCYAVYRKRGSPCPGCPSIPALATGEAHSEIVPYASEDNPTRWIDLSAFPLKNPAGRVVGIIEYAKDITRRRQAKEALRESEAQKRAILDASIDMIRYVDKDMRIIWANKTTTTGLNITPEEVAGRFCYELFLGRKAPCEGCPSLRTLETGQIEHAVMHELKVAGRQAETYWDCYGVPMKDESGRIIRLIQIARDITEQKQAEKGLKKRHNELEAINGVLLRLTKEDNLNGMGQVLQDIMEDFYPEFDVMIFLLTPDRDGFYFPRPERGQVRETCYDRAERKIVDLKLDHALLEFLAKEKAGPACSGREKVDCPAIIRALAAGFRTWMAVPIELDDGCLGLFMLGSPSVDMHVEGDLIFVETLIRQISGVIRYQISKEAREEAFREQLAGPDKFMGIVGQSRPMQEVYRMIQAVADSASTVLVTGESGTGKELVARAVHRAGKYKDAPFIAAHCSSFVPTLVHSEIFGHEKGAFTGATSRRLGRLERAQGGILFLDEVADLPLETQVLLLRFLQDKSFERVGGERPVEVNVRVVAATNKDIEKEMKAGRLREDFYYRLNVIQLKLPPLRERITDVPLLADHFLRTYCLIEGKEITGFDTEALKLMMDYDWPGNVRELQNTVARCLVLTSDSRIGVDVLPARIRSAMDDPKEFSLARNERSLIVSAMRECDWNKHRAARLLDISRGTLYSKLNKHNIRP
ncbi:MAG: sigma 54-interacting transcriptional regulator [Desulfobacterales bacterium]|nr:sigma 54-interacting transcriptional regulator [Desulfobacterales bacterium]